MRRGLRAAFSAPRICHRTYARRAAGVPRQPAVRASRPQPAKAEATVAVGATRSGAAGYGDLDYWNQRYAKASEDPFDWYQSWSDLRDVLRPLFRPTDRIMVVGCGNSTLSQDLVQDGYANVVSIDYSPVVIERMKQRHPTLDWRVADATTLADFASGSFDVAIDKGTLDALLCGPGSTERAAAMLASVARVLRNDGLLVEVTHSPFETRQSYFAGLPYAVEERTVPKGKTKEFHFVLMCRKK